MSHVVKVSSQKTALHVEHVRLALTVRVNLQPVMNAKLAISLIQAVPLVTSVEVA
ncbi:hypothetical protein D3C80_2111830 [compost metagenome]